MMFNMIVLVLSVLGILELGSAELLQLGQCESNTTLATNLNLTQFLGRWNVIAATTNPLLNGDCSFFEWSSENDTLSVVNRVVNNNFLKEISGTAVLESEAKFTINVSTNQAIDFWVLLTDHTNFAVAFDCEDFNSTHRTLYIWQMGRETTYPNEMMPALMNQTLHSQLGVMLSDLTPLDHSDSACEVLPLIPEGQPIILTGQCDPNITVVQNFSVSSFTGVWHEISSYYSENALGTCPRAEYTLAGSVVNVLNSQVVNETLATISGNADVSSTDGSARLLVTLEVQPGVFVQSPLWVLATDYVSYAVSYVCVDLPDNQKKVNSWILSRSRQLTSAAQTAVNQVINSQIDLNTEYFITADQSDDGCFFYPDPIPEQPVVFRGQCDMNITAVPAFDVERYMGLWHDIESYPSTFQGGSCNNAYYTLNNGMVDVFNTQVVNQTLDTIDGVARIASTDGSAKLTVTFPIVGTNLTIETDYWVLATDYSSYALVYTCLNLNDDERQVWSWKLSRTKQLSTNATFAINQVINTVPVLDQRYYAEKDQSTDGCFYYPEAEPGVPVVFPGQCQDSIQVVQSFNISQFQGPWYEIEAYPKNEETGQCIQHSFTVANNSFNLESSSITDQFLGVTNSTVTFNSTDGSAKLVITITTDGQDVIIPYWILSTDYTSYALAYSCINLNDDFRAIYSWKLSRTRQLSSTAIANINDAISNITVLGNHYYENIDQSDSACFYLPELAPGEPIILNGQCDANITVMQNFNATRYLGRWRLIESYPSDFQNGTCNDATYSVDNGTVVVYNTQVINQTLDTIIGSAEIIEANGTGKLLVTFPGAPAPIEYWILDTDYESYSLVYSCYNVTNQTRRVWSWKLSRTRNLDAIAIENMNRVINSIEVLNNRYYEILDQSDDGCFYYPEPEPYTPVIFPGQCDRNISVVTGFDVTNYMNLWHDIQSYPTSFQEGTCNNAYYTLVNGTVDVFNTQVINQTLDTINGIGRLATTDGSAKLIVTFPVAGTNSTIETDYWVLATDYTSYALVYTCFNIDEEYRQVWSWKLSRTKQLTSNATTAIDNVISTIPVLDNRYYNLRDQSVDGCFYFPEPEPGVPVQFPGQCNQSIPAAANFNMTAFEGTWYEIEAYPKDQQSGQCINHQYNSGTNNTLSLISSNIINQILGTTPGNVSFASAQDSSGRLTISINSNNTVITIPFWILSTDYTSYALAYSCVDINDDFRGVYSWKLSRTKQLTSAAITAINSVIDTVVVLENRYYETIDQTDEACFYLPDLPPGQPVVFSGQCDQNITVVQNLNVTRYLGRWRLIESYPTEFQNGTCNDATYSLNANNTVNVFNTQVINQELDTITGTAVATDGSGKLLVYFPNSPEPAEYWILDTDYDSFSLVYSCVNLNTEQRRVTSWKLSRTSQLTAAAITRINNVVDGINVLNSLYYADVDQSDDACFYYPPPDATPVTFRGQCNQSIPVVTNFNAERYMGLWHDVRSYPGLFQDGTCNNAYYTLVNGTVDVFNTQVINQTLDTINGVAELATTDGSAKLIVTFPVAGTNLTINTEYWVLATDYDSYSLVYTCNNINEEQRQVWSWVLSRTKQLPANVTTEINNVTSLIPVLDDRYYISRDQSENGCFYYPEPQPGVPVQFPGQCNQSIPAVANFNMTAFEGIWNEIEAYPKEQQSGQCVNHQYTSGANNTLNLVSSNVINQILGTTPGNVSFAAPQDSSGRLVITITSNNTVITIPFWILSTDYTSYALAYSCVDISDDFRGVYSWKLSRTKQLTSAANTTINTVIDGITVLENRYYETINQSDEACFYLPDHVPGNPVVFVGQCDQNISVVQNFNATRYLGTWRLIESYPTQFQNGTCIDATYSLGQNDTVTVFNTQVINQELDTITGYAVVASNDSSGKLLVYFPDSPVPAEYWILDTDYDSFSLVYSCANLNTEQRRVTSWKLSRSAELSAAASIRINQVVDSINVLDAQYYENIDQSDGACFYYPTPDSNTPVVFRGQCDQNISVVTNFNATRYIGLWHDIESYPTINQEGTCNNAYYSLNNEVVDVFNTQVINQTLDTISGFATAATDGSAKLVVTFPAAGTNNTNVIDYWVLATDYSSYSLVYTCRNIDNEKRAVWSWKLSRAKQLTAAASNAINAVTNTIPVLDNRYYNLRDQSDDGCFYFPEPQEGVPVTFPGQCDDSIPAMANFNVSSFEGIWHEIQAYPTGQNIGQCVNNEFLTVNGSLTLISRSVDQLSLLQASGTLRPNTTANTDGKFILTTVINNTVVEIPYWILDTDYTGYALAYSCVSLTQDTRSVYSWKLSRSKQLSSAATIAMNTAISNITVLDDRYYENTNQSDESCFYLPDLAPGEPVVFVGQCDLNIPVVQNFNPTRYAGRWRMIESYSSDFQSGTCNDATYTLNGTTVLVYNTQVINETLDTINGTAVLATTDGSGKLLVTFPGTQTPSEYWILDTDYDSYALVYSCRNIGTEQRRVWSWKLSRTRDLTTNATASIDQIIQNVNVLDDRYYTIIDHSDNGCFYYPTPDGNPVTFRGQCNESIAVVNNFNATAYMGTWYDIEGYPTQFQNGTCPSATYTLTANGVDVYNTQVVAQELDTINGVAVLATTDGTAKLNVTFPIAGTNLTIVTPYWILTTDYNNYSLVYSCVNIDEEHRRVSSWKLSRALTLSQTSVAAINNVVNTVQVLRDDYYLTRGHSEEDCFYYPDNEGGPVVLEGQCELNNLSVVNNFNANLFAGDWYETARFPSELQTGECVENKFTIATQNSFNLTKNIVYNERMTTMTGPATLSPDGRGIIDVRLADDAGASFETTFYVLDVEYNDFVLLYGCLDTNNTHKQVYSWKLSRSQQGLSSSATQRIDDIIANTTDLFQGYYDTTDQTLNSCFYYPVFDELPPVIELIGPCDESIRGVQNFSIDAYVGKWYEIASYPHPYQNGDCAREQYERLNENVANSSITITNTQVFNETLNVRSSNAFLASSDGSGVLAVTTGTNVSYYYVLETDYTNFALLYTCQNLDSGKRQVSSWKLSRERTLNSTAEEIINNTISRTQGLQQEYYAPTNQTDEVCFYIPELDENKAPLFRGRCANITGVQGFDAQRYLGWWHEIERYPSDIDVGECISSEFIASGNQYQIVDKNIFGVNAQSNTSTVTVTTDGRLRKTFSNGQEIDVWILATDYETYSLLYTCENVDDEYMRIWSAKHSKSRNLTSLAQQAMESVIEANKVLVPKFYLPVDQSATACFYYPEIFGERVILPGSCDENIPVQQEFDPAQYSGTWYQIERYSQIYENGTCVGARYTLNENTGVVTVLNWQVIDDVLDTVQGEATVNSTDGSAKLIVKLPIRGTDDPEPTMVSMWLYVLETDYISYSLTYSCEDVDEFHRAVGAWKLSRARSLPSDGNTAINAYMATREELHQPYFISVEQNNECDEPSSSIIIRNSIIIMMVCVVIQLLLQ